MVSNIDHHCCLPPAHSLKLKTDRELSSRPMTPGTCGIVLPSPSASPRKASESRPWFFFAGTRQHKTIDPSREKKTRVPSRPWDRRWKYWGPKLARKSEATVPVHAALCKLVSWDWLIAGRNTPADISPQHQKQQKEPQRHIRSIASKKLLKSFTGWAFF